MKSYLTGAPRENSAHPVHFCSLNNLNCLQEVLGPWQRIDWQDAPMCRLIWVITGHTFHLSRLMTKPTKWLVRPSKTQISLGIRPVWSDSSLCALRVSKKRFLHVDSEDSDQTGQMPRLIWVFAGHTCHFVAFVMRLLILLVLLVNLQPEENTYRHSKLKYSCACLAFSFANVWK